MLGVIVIGVVGVGADVGGFVTFVMCSRQKNTCFSGLFLELWVSEPMLEGV